LDGLEAICLSRALRIIAASIDVQTQSALGDTTKLKDTRKDVSAFQSNKELDTVTVQLHFARPA
jgi:hypothetical protein